MLQKCNGSCAALVVFCVEICSKLPHVLYTPDNTVCLFTKAEKKEAMKLLEAKGVTGVTKVTIYLTIYIFT